MKKFNKRYWLAVSYALMLATAFALPGAYAEEETPFPPPTVFDVNVVNLPNVSVINPLPVADMQNPAFNPFQVYTEFSLRRGEGSAEAVLPPAGNDEQRVVIEHVTVDAEVPQGQRIVAYIKLGEIKHSLVLTSQGSWGKMHRFRTSQPIRLYSLGGGDGMAFAGVERSATSGSAHLYFTVSGYLVDLDDLP